MIGPLALGLWLKLKSGSWARPSHARGPGSVHEHTLGNFYHDFLQDVCLGSYLHFHISLMLLSQTAFFAAIYMVFNS
jgi:hypothetical protein